MKRLAAALALALLPGCAIERGKPWDVGPPPSRPVPGVSLVLLGDVGAGGRAGAVVAAEVERVLAEHRRAGRPALVLWLGDNVGPVGPGNLGRCTPPERAFQARGPGALARVARAHAGSGGAVLAALGEQDWRCGQPELELQTAAKGPLPWSMPAHNYVARVYPDGQVKIAATCARRTCEVAPPDPAALVELVVVDSAAWFTPPAAGTPAAARADESLAEQAALLAVLAGQTGGPPRVLVSHHPLETVGPHGLGGLYSDSGFFLHPEPLQRAVDAGVFAGAVSAHDRVLLAESDISDAVKRSSRHWLKGPVFQVVSGATSAPDGRPGAGARGWVYYQGQSLRADLQTNRAGFAELQVRPDGFTAVLHRRKAGRWGVGRVEIARDRPPHPVETRSPGMEPCLRCDPVPPRL